MSRLTGANDAGGRVQPPHSQVSSRSLLCVGLARKYSHNTKAACNSKHEPDTSRVQLQLLPVLTQCIAAQSPAIVGIVSLGVKATILDDKVKGIVLQADAMLG